MSILHLRYPNMMPMEINATDGFEGGPSIQ